LLQCDSSFDDQKWTRIKAGSKFENGFGLCLAYDTNAESMVQQMCTKDNMIGGTQSWSFIKASTPTTTAQPGPTQSGSQVRPCRCMENRDSGHLLFYPRFLC
jgi:hypothetical protein